MNSVLFVDDDPQVLKALGGALRKFRSEWACRYAEGATSALTMMESESADVIISDVRMPGIDGVALLTEVQRRWPDTIRVALSGQTELSNATRLVNVAHLFLNKPTDASTLRECVARALTVRGMMSDARLRELVGGIGQLPQPPALATRLTSLLQDPNTSTRSISDAIEEHPTFAVKVLKVVNSSFFGPAQRSASVSHAVTILGAKIIRDLLMGIEVFEGFSSEWRGRGFTFEGIRAHGALAGQIARWLPLKAQESDLACTASLLKDVGRVILATRTADRYAGVLARARADVMSLSDAERAEYGVSHAEVGGYLLGLWGFSWPVVESILFQDRPSQLPPTAFSAAAAVHVTSAIAARVLPPLADGVPAPTLDAPMLEAMGVRGDALDTWLVRARALADTRVTQ